MDREGTPKGRQRYDGRATTGQGKDSERTTEAQRRGVGGSANARRMGQRMDVEVTP